MNQNAVLVAFAASLLGAPAFAQVAAPALARPSPALAAWTPSSAPGGSWQVNTYTWDDGSCENSLGWTTGTTSTTYDMGWINGFDAVNGADTITAVLTTFGSAGGTGTILNGDPATVAVWEDPNDDGNPNDAVLLTQSAIQIANVYTNTFNSYPVAPVLVTGHFFVGCWTPTNTATNPPTPGVGEFPAPMDNSSAAPMRSFYVGGNPVNPNNLAGNPNTVTDLTTFYQGTFMVRAEGSGAAPFVYCVPKTNSLGCTPSIGFTGAPSATAGSGFVVRASNVRNNKNGLLFYGVSGQANTPFQGGTLCVNPQIKRTGAVNSGGNPAPANDCSGIYALDMNAFAVSPGPPVPLAALTVSGTIVDCQWWGRDPGFPPPNNTTLSDGLQYTVP
jgi:hypothetical protein